MKLIRSVYELVEKNENFNNTLNTLYVSIQERVKRYNSIMKIRNYQIQLMKRRGGVGYDLSKLRPNGAMVNNAASTSTGAASFMDVNSALTNEVAMNGRRK